LPEREAGPDTPSLGAYEPIVADAAIVKDGTARLARAAAEYQPRPRPTGFDVIVCSSLRCGSCTCRVRFPQPSLDESGRAPDFLAFSSAAPRARALLK
jgi:hypothetical protein